MNCELLFAFYFICALYRNQHSLIKFDGTLLFLVEIFLSHPTRLHMHLARESARTFSNSILSHKLKYIILNFCTFNFSLVCIWTLQFALSFQTIASFATNLIVVWYWLHGSILGFNEVLCLVSKHVFSGCITVEKWHPLVILTFISRFWKIAFLKLWFECLLLWLHISETVVCF